MNVYHRRSPAPRLMPMALALSVASLLLLGQAMAQQPTIESVREQLGKANAELRAKYERYEGTGIVTDTADHDQMPERAKEAIRKRGQPVPTGRQILGKKKVNFTADGSRKKLVIENESTEPEGTAKGKDSPSPVRKTELRIEPEKSSWLEWRGSSNEPVVKSLSKDGGTESLLLANEVGVFLKATHSLPFGSLSDLLKDSSFKVERVTQIEGKPSPLIQLDFERTAPVTSLIAKKQIPPPSRTMTGTITVDPSLGWAIRAYRYADRSNPDRYETVRIEYADDSKDGPKPKTIAMDASGQRIRELKLDAFNFLTGKAPDFSVESSGLPSPAATPADIEAEKSGRGWWLILLGLVVIGAGVFLWYRSQQKRPS